MFFFILARSKYNWGSGENGENQEPKIAKFQLLLVCDTNLLIFYHYFSAILSIFSDAELFCSADKRWKASHRRKLTNIRNINLVRRMGHFRCIDFNSDTLRRPKNHHPPIAEIRPMPAHNIRDNRAALCFLPTKHPNARCVPFQSAHTLAHTNICAMLTFPQSCSSIAQYMCVIHSRNREQSSWCSHLCVCCVVLIACRAPSVANSCTASNGVCRQYEAGAASRFV